jgi:hypothetical protein
MINLQMLQLPLTLSPNEVRRINFTGSFISILSNTTNIDPIVSADNGTSTAIKAGVGLPAVQLSDDQTSLIPAVFRYVDFKNPSENEEMTIVFLLSLGTALDTRAVIQGYLQMDLSAPIVQTSETLNVLTTEFSILPSNALVKERIVQNNGESPIWWGDVNTDPATSRGLVINPGGSAVINCWGSVYFKAQYASSVLSVVNILKVF